MSENSWSGLKEIKTQKRKEKKKENEKVRDTDRGKEPSRVGNQEIRGNFLECWPREKLASLYPVRVAGFEIV